MKQDSFRQKLIRLVSLDQDAMSAVSLASQVAFVLQLFNFAISGGASMFAAQFWGKGDKKRAIEKFYAFCMKLVSERAIISYGTDYLRVAGFSYIFLSLMLVIETIMKNTMLVKPVTVISSMMVFLNIGLNAVFIYGLFGAP